MTLFSRGRQCFHTFADLNIYLVVIFADESKLFPFFPHTFENKILTEGLININEMYTSMIFYSYIYSVAMFA